MVPRTDAREHVTLTDSFDGPLINIDSAAGLANLLDCFLRVMRLLRETHRESIHCLQAAMSGFIAALRDVFHDSGVLDNIAISF